jgi:hypothetical protein
VRLPVIEDNRDGRYNVSAACWQLNGELNAYTLTRGDRETAFIHQLQVDAYGAQHVAVGQPSIGPAFALIGLYLTCERGFTGRQVQHTHMLLARRSKSWPRFAPPPSTGHVTVLDVMQAPPGEERDTALRRWGCSVWRAWDHEHERIRSLFESVMAD